RHTCAQAVRRSRSLIAALFSLPPLQLLQHLARPRRVAVCVQPGAFEVTVVSDGHLVLPTSFLAPEAPPAEPEVLLKAAGQSEEQYNPPSNVTLIRSDSDLILVDAQGDQFMPTAGKLWDNLKTAGVDKAKITKVIFTHGHPDHLWGTVDELDELTIPDATFYVASAEWNLWNRRQCDPQTATGSCRLCNWRTPQLHSDQRQGKNGQRR